MKKAIILSLGLMMANEPWAAGTSGVIQIRLTIPTQCHIGRQSSSATTSAIDCVNQVTLQPKMIKQDYYPKDKTLRKERLITLEW